MLHNTLLSAFPCKTVPIASVAAGAIASYTGLDTFFAKQGAPPAVHYMLAGLAPEYVARMQKGDTGLPLDVGGLCAAGFGYLGGVGLPYVMRAVGM